MSLDVWFRDDIRRVLLALNEASVTTCDHVSPDDDAPSVESYREGYADALRAVAIAFGISSPRVPDRRPPQMPPDTVSASFRPTVSDSRDTNA